MNYRTSTRTALSFIIAKHNKEIWYEDEVLTMLLKWKKHWETQEETPVYIAGPFGAYTDAFEDSELREGFYWNCRSCWNYSRGRISMKTVHKFKPHAFGTISLKKPIFSWQSSMGRICFVVIMKRSEVWQEKNWKQFELGLRYGNLISELLTILMTMMRLAGGCKSVCTTSWWNC